MREHDQAGKGPVATQAREATAPAGKSTLSVPHETSDPSDDLVRKVKHAALSSHAGAALKLMVGVDGAQQGRIAEEIGADARRAFARHMPHNVGDSPAKKATAKVLFDHTPSSEVPTLELWFEARFRLDLGSHPFVPEIGKGVKWDATGLRRMWEVFDALPPEHVAHNWAVAKIERYRDADDKNIDHAHGYAALNELGLSYTPDIVRDGGTTDHDMAGDPLFGVNRFDEVARHEVGHGVDRELGQISEKILMHSSEAGRWKLYEGPAGYHRCAKEMLDRTTGALGHLAGKDRKKVLEAIVHAMEQSSARPFNHAVEKLHGHAEYKQDPLYAIMNHGMATQDPWKHAGPALDGRHFHQTYKNYRWASYDTSAYQAHRVSEYMFRAPGEWFAEAYAAFYTPGEGTVKGERLKAKNPATHAWFVANVDNARAVDRRADRARGAAQRRHEPIKR